jgi:hypothetical protein
MTRSFRRRAAAVALAVSAPLGVGALAANTAFLATTADGGQPVMYPPGYPRPGIPKPVPGTDPAPAPVVDPVTGTVSD